MEMSSRVGLMGSDIFSVQHQKFEQNTTYRGITTKKILALLPFVKSTTITLQRQ
jgi:hypothetical protein